MLTVLSVEEFEKLSRDRKLVKSENFGFIAEDTQSFLGEVFGEKTESSMANIIHLHSIGGVETLEVKNEVLEDSNDGVLAFLPELESGQVLVVTKPNKEIILIGASTLDDLEAASITAEEEKEFYKQVLSEEINKDEECVYAVTTALEFESIITVLYNEDLEEQMSKLKELNKNRDVLYKPTKMFN